MLKKITPQPIEGVHTAQPSKSYAQRALACAFIKKTPTQLFNIGNAKDTCSVVAFLEQCNIKTTLDNTSLNIEHLSAIQIPPKVTFGESGLATRLFIPLLAAMNASTTIEGTGSILNRDMAFFEQVLPQLGVSVQSYQQKLPITIKGQLQAKTITCNAYDSSQYISGLIYAYSYLEAEGVSITIEDMVSADYLDMTIDMLHTFGLHTPTREGNMIHFPNIKKQKQAINTYTVEGDWSNAAFFLVAGCIAGKLNIKGLDVFSKQGDKAILTALQDIGCLLSINTEQVKIKHHTITPFFFDATDYPDLIPPLVALGAYANGISVCRGANRLLNKESNRAIALIEEFSKLGVKIVQQDDDLLVYGTGKVLGATVQSHNDHRIAMALSIAALKAETPITIANAEAIEKSYPDFYKDLEQLSIN